MQGREKNRWLHQFALYPSKGFGPEAQSKFAYRRERVGAVVGRNRSGEGRICEPTAMEGCGGGVTERLARIGEECEPASDWQSEPPSLWSTVGLIRFGHAFGSFEIC
jgi:hypothetical protein